MARENVSNLNQVDHFLAAGQRCLRLYDAAERRKFLSPEFAGIRFGLSHECLFM